MDEWMDGWTHKSCYLRYENWNIETLPGRIGHSNAEISEISFTFGKDDKHIHGDDYEYGEYVLHMFRVPKLYLQHLIKHP